MRGLQFALGTLLISACATAGGSGTERLMGPGDFEVQNGTACVARLWAVGPAGENRQVLADLEPGQRTVVTLFAGTGMHVVFYASGGARLDQPGRDCRATGRIQVRRSSARGVRG